MKEAVNVPHREHVLGMRRALLADPLSLQVHAWLRPIYLRSLARLPVLAAKTTIAGMVSVLSPIAESDPRVRKALQSVSHFVSSPLSAEYAKTFESIKRPNSNVLSTFVSVVYARAMLLLMSSAMEGPAMILDLKKILSNPAAAIDKYLAAQGRLDENFVGHLVTHAEIEAQIDPNFERVLEGTAQLFFKTHRPNKDARNPLSDPGSRLDLLKSEDSSAWWRLPANLAFAMTVWEQRA